MYHWQFMIVCLNNSYLINFSQCFCKSRTFRCLFFDTGEYLTVYTVYTVLHTVQCVPRNITVAWQIKGSLWSKLNKSLCKHNFWWKFWCHDKLLKDKHLKIQTPERQTPEIMKFFSEWNMIKFINLMRKNPQIY